MLGDSELISLRSREVTNRPLLTDSDVFFLEEFGDVQWWKQTSGYQIDLEED